MDSTHSQEVPAVEDAVVYVEELASADDYWLSITDASRVCRVQDVSIRRAINRQRLPVRRQRAGQNKRTRFVRASDLALAGFPIIDESAMITTDIGKVDILSIPQQQQQIIQDHQALTLRLSDIQEMLANYQQHMVEDLRQQQEHFQAALHSTQAEQAHQLAATKITLEQAQEKLQRVLVETTRHVTTEQQTLRRDLALEQADARSRAEQAQTALKSLSEDLTREQADTQARDADLLATVNTLQSAFHKYQEEVQHQLTHLTTTQQDYQQTLDTTIQRIEQEAQKRFITIEQRVTDNLKQLEQTFDRQLSGLAKTLAQIAESAENLHQSTATREQELDRTLQQMQTQLSQHEQLLPLLPYAQQRLVSEQDIAAWPQTLVDLEACLRADQQGELARYQPLLALLSPERLEVLAHLLANQEVSTTQDVS